MVAHKKKGKKNHIRNNNVQMEKVQGRKDDAVVEEVLTETLASTTLRKDSRPKEVKSQNNIPDLKKRMILSGLLNGVVGGFVVVLFLVLMAFICPRFRFAAYYVAEDTLKMDNPMSACSIATDSIALGSAIQGELVRRQDLIKDLVEQKVIVSSEDFASNLSNYYNALISVLAAVLIILNLVGYFSWRNNADLSLEQRQRELDDVLNNIDDRLERNLDEILRKNQVIKDRLELYISESLEQRECLDDEEWSKLHLLLATYERQEVLKAISNDNADNNDGEIER